MHVNIDREKKIAQTRSKKRKNLTYDDWEVLLFVTCYLHYPTIEI